MKHCIWYPRLTIFISGIHETQYLCPDHVSDFIYCRSHPIKFFLCIYSKTAILVVWSRPYPEICHHDQPMSYLLTGMNSLEKLRPPEHADRPTDTHTYTHTPTHTHTHTDTHT